MEFGTWMLIRAGFIGVLAIVFAAALGLVRSRLKSMENHEARLLKERVAIEGRAKEVGWNRKAGKRVKVIKRELKEIKSEKPGLEKKETILEVCMFIAYVAFVVLFAIFEGGDVGVLITYGVGAAVIVALNLCAGTLKSWLTVVLLGMYAALIGMKLFAMFS